MEIGTYQEAINYLETFISPILFKRIEENPEFDPLERMRILLKLLGNPEQKFKSVLITGTAGKGSTAYLISHILRTAGYKTGFTLSPHLEKINERLQINGRSISDSSFVSLVSSLVGKIEQMKKMSVGKPSYFEILIVMAFEYFAQQKVDIAVVEVGIEGKYDATNVLMPLIVVLTNIYLDHTQILGETVEAIAKEAVGAIKKSKIKNKISNIVVTGAIKPSIIKIIKDRSKKMGAQLNLLWRNFGYKIKKENIFGTDFDFISHEENLDDLWLSLLGQYQAENASLAIKTALELRKLGFSPSAKASRDKKITDEVIRKALKTAFFPGRFEIVRGPVGLHPRPTSSVASLSSGARRGSPAPATPLIILDGAHNPAKMKAFTTSLEKLFPKEKKVFLVAFKKDKNIKEMLSEIVKSADSIIITEFGRATDTGLHVSADAEEVKNQILKIKKNIKIVIEKDSKKALALALKILKTQYPNNPNALIVTGSLYLVGEIRNLCQYWLDDS